MPEPLGAGHMAASCTRGGRSQGGTAVQEPWQQRTQHGLHSFFLGMLQCGVPSGPPTWPRSCEGYRPPDRSTSRHLGTPRASSLSCSLHAEASCAQHGSRLRGRGGWCHVLCSFIQPCLVQSLQCPCHPPPTSPLLPPHAPGK